MNSLFAVIYEDDDLLVVHKPADLVCHPTKGDQYSSLISRARIYLKTESEPRLVNRLDRETSGLVVIAKNAQAARELGQLWETRAIVKEYLAIVHGHMEADQGEIDVALGKDVHSKVAIKDCVRADGAPARTKFQIEKRFTRQDGKFTLVLVSPLTGRKHQIRIHLAHLGHPIVGDKLYGGDEDLYLALVERRLTEEQRGRLILSTHALHAGRLKFQWRNQDFDLTTLPEPQFQQFLG